MKKTVAVILSLCLVMSAGAVIAEENMHDEVKINLSLKHGYCHSTDGQAVLDISDGENTYTKIIDIGNSVLSQEVTFYVDGYSDGDSFIITPIGGVSALFFNDEKQDSITLTPSFENGQQLPITVEYIPECHNALNVAVNGEIISFSKTARNIGENVIVPMQEMAEALSLNMSYADDIYTAASPTAAVSYDAAQNVFRTETHSSTKKQYDAPCAAQDISGTLFVPVSLFADAYNLTLIMDQSGDKPTLYIATAKLEQTSVNNDYVNRTGLSSETDYLVWISKSEYKVRVYIGSKGNWNEVKAFTCGIGAPGTPTCEGTYKYYQAQSKWDYNTYYVGPVMRFNGGYAIHSTLLYPNGTPKDNRVGMKISHGCIRLRPDDIGWMFYYVPLRTTIHITT